MDAERASNAADYARRCAYCFGLDFDDDEPLRDRLKEASEDFTYLAGEIEALDRTCRVDSVYELADPYSWATSFEVELSCGHSLTWYSGDAPAYCPKCGARVVRDDGREGD